MPWRRLPGAEVPRFEAVGLSSTPPVTMTELPDGTVLFDE
jgi:hypothetical protein